MRGTTRTGGHDTVRKPFKRVARAQQVEAGVAEDGTIPEQGRLPEVDETEESLSEDSDESFSGNE